MDTHDAQISALNDRIAAQHAEIQYLKDAAWRCGRGRRFVDLLLAEAARIIGTPPPEGLRETLLTGLTRRPSYEVVVDEKYSDSLCVNYCFEFYWGEDVIYSMTIIYYGGYSRDYCAFLTNGTEKNIDTDCYSLETWEDLSKIPPYAIVSTILSLFDDGLEWENLARLLRMSDKDVC